MTCFRSFIVAAIALALSIAPAAAQQKPLVIMSGQTRQLPSGTTLGVQPSTSGAASINIPQGTAPTSPSDGDCWTTTGGYFCRTNGATTSIKATAKTNTELAAMPSSLGSVVREGYYAQGDSPPVSYVASASACSLNAGAGDNGSQVASSDGKCWVAAFPAGGIDVRQFGARCDNSTDDAPVLAKALTYAGSLSSAVLRLPGSNYCKVSSTLTVSGGTSIIGAGPHAPSGLSAGVINLNPMLNVTGNGTTLSDFYISADAAGTNTSGMMISLAAATGTNRVSNLIISGACNALDVNGTLHSFRDIYIVNGQGASCNAVQVGRLTTAAGSVDDLLDYVVVQSVSGAGRLNSCFMVYDAGGLFIAHSDALQCKNGTVLMPGANQSVDWPTFHDTYLGDGTYDSAFKIDTSSASAVVRGLSCGGCWASSSATASGVDIQNNGAGTISGLNFAGLRAINNADNGVKNTVAAADLRISASFICSYGGSGVYLPSGVSSVSVDATTIKPTCMGQTGGSGQYAVMLVGANNNISLTNLDVRGQTVSPISGVPVGASFVSGIMDAFNAFQSIASAATLNLSSVHPNWSVTGTTGVSNINGAWSGRQVTMVTVSGAISFSTGGNICNAFTSTQNVPVIATYLGSCWYLK